VDDEGVTMVTTTRGFLVWIGLVAAACSSPGTMATPEQRAQEERRLLAPYLADREVGCGELVVEATGNLYAYIGQPAVDESRVVKTREDGDGFVDTVYTSKAPDAAFPIRLTIGEAQKWTASGGFVLGKQTTFKVVNQLRVRLYEDRRPFTLNASAGGGFVLVKDAAGTPPREVPKFADVDGVLHRQ